MKLLDIPLDLMIHSKNPITSAIKGLIMTIESAMLIKTLTLLLMEAFINYLIY